MADKMETYETIMILSPELTEGVRQSFISDIASIFATHSDKPVHISEWGEKSLAYPIKHHKRGYYVVLFHRDTEEGAKILTHTLDTQSSTVIKHIMVRHDDISEFDRDWEHPEEGFRIHWPGSSVTHSEQPKPDAYDVILGLANYNN